MTNYVVEGGLDLWKMLTEDVETESDQDGVCLLTGETLGPNYVRLPCNHKFNYMSLVKELVALRTPTQYCGYRLPPRSLICPYCRQVNEGLILHINSEAGETTVKNVTTSIPGRAIPHRHCEHTFKSGVSKGQRCSSKHAYHSGDVIRCVKHHRERERATAAKAARNKVMSDASTHCRRLMRCKCTDLRAYLADHTTEPSTGTKAVLAMRVFAALGSDDPSAMKMALDNKKE